MNFNIARHKHFESNIEVEKIVELLKKGDFERVNVKKLTPTDYFRAKINYRDRLIFAIAQYNGESALLLLEIIKEHDYTSSKFLYGKRIEEGEFRHDEVTAIEVPESVLTHSKPFRYIDRFMTFSDAQESAVITPLPAIIIGSAGSGKTSVIIERLKIEKGRVAYITMSPFLSQKVSESCAGYKDIDFKCFGDLIAPYVANNMREADYDDFTRFCALHGIKKERESLYEEIRGVIAGTYSSPYLSKEEYFALGVRKTLFHGNGREDTYCVFMKYLIFLTDNGLYDPSIIAYAALKERDAEIYDFIIIDEVQDMTAMQVRFVIEKYGRRGQFILSGDANQVVYANYFSWSAIREMLHSDSFDGHVSILDVNYRCSEAIAIIANKLLLLKSHRFGSIDRESDTPMLSVLDGGSVVLMHKSKGAVSKISTLVSNSMEYAIVVFDDNAKSAAEKEFSTPLIFTVSEIKGLEYPNIVVVDMVSAHRKQFSEIASGIVLGENRSFTRNKNKENREADSLKVYINSLYVAFTRAIKSLYIIESDHHGIWDTIGLGMEGFEKRIAGIPVKGSADSEWRVEAQRLRKAGKISHAEKIEKMLTHDINSEIVVRPVQLTQTLEYTPSVMEAAFNPDQFNKKAKDELFVIASAKNDHEILERLSLLKYKPAAEYLKKVSIVPNQEHVLLPVRPVMKLADEHIKSLSKLSDVVEIAYAVERAIGEELTKHIEHLDVAFTMGKQVGVEMASKILAELKLLRIWSEKNDSVITAKIDQLAGSTYLITVDPSRRNLFTEDEANAIAYKAEMNYRDSGLNGEPCVGVVESLVAQGKDDEAIAFITEIKTIEKQDKFWDGYYDYRLMRDYMRSTLHKKSLFYNEILVRVEQSSRVVFSHPLLTMLYDDDDYSMLDDAQKVTQAIIKIISGEDKNNYTDRFKRFICLLVGLRGICGLINKKDLIIVQKEMPAGLLVLLQHLSRTNNISPDLFNKEDEKSAISVETLLVGKEPYEYIGTHSSTRTYDDSWLTISKSVYFRKTEMFREADTQVKDTLRHLKNFWENKKDINALFEYALLAGGYEQIPVYKILKRDYPKVLKYLREHSKIGLILSNEDLYSNSDKINVDLNPREKAFLGQLMMQEAFYGLKSGETVVNFTKSAEVILEAYAEGAYWCEKSIEKIASVMTDGLDEAIKNNEINKYKEVKVIDKELMVHIVYYATPLFRPSVVKLIKRLVEDKKFMERYTKTLFIVSEMILDHIISIEDSINFDNEKKLATSKMQQTNETKESQ